MNESITMSLPSINSLIHTTKNEKALEPKLQRLTELPPPPFVTAILPKDNHGDRQRDDVRWNDPIRAAQTQVNDPDGTGHCAQSGKNDAHTTLFFTVLLNDLGRHSNQKCRQTKNHRQRPKKVFHPHLPLLT